MPQLASVMIRVFPSLEHSTDCVRKPADNFRTFVCVPYWHQKVRPLSAGLSDTLRECSNVEETQNGMPATAWKKYMNFASKNLPPSVYSGTFLFSDISVILLIRAKHAVLSATVLFFQELNLPLELHGNLAFG